MPLCGVEGTVGLSSGTGVKGERAEDACGGPSQEAVLRVRLPECTCTRFLNDGSRVVVTVAATRKGLVVATNSVADDLFCSATEMATLMHQHRVLPMHVLASMISPDRHLLYEAEVSTLCSQVRPYTAIVKVCARNGQSQLYILQAHAMQISGVPEACGPATVLTLERCPASRHLNAHPGQRQGVGEMDRWEPQPVVYGERPGAIKAHRALHPIACLAIPLAGTRD